MTMPISRGHIGIVFGYRKRVTRGRTTFRQWKDTSIMRLKFFNGFVILFILERALAIKSSSFFENQLQHDIETLHQGDQILQKRGTNIFELNIYKSKLLMFTMF